MIPPGNRLKDLIIIALIISSFFSCQRGDSQTSKKDGQGKYKIIAYVFGSKTGEIPDSLVSMLTHINYAFAKVVDGEIRFQFRRPEHEQLVKQSVARIIGLKKINPDLKVLLSVGGWGAEGFSDAALTDESRKKFAESGTRIVVEYGFDGLDIDWEYPGQPGAGNVFRPDDRENFTLMLKSLREELDHKARELKRARKSPFLLTIATGADQAYVDHTVMAEAEKYLDFINIMTYDFYSGLSSVSGHHSNLYEAAVPGPQEISTEIAVERHIKEGIPVEKLVVGVPFYGRYWKGVSDSSNGLYQPSRSMGLYKGYKEIKTKYLNNPAYTRFWDADARAPYLYSGDSAMFISYDDPESLKLKCNYVKQHRLAGIMFWELSQDYQGELLDAIFENLKSDD